MFFFTGPHLVKFVMKEFHIGWIENVYVVVDYHHSYCMSVGITLSVCCFIAPILCLLDLK